MRALVIVGILSVLVLRVGLAGASADPYRDQAERIPCPAAPPGWTNPPESPGGRYIITPFTAVALTDDPTTLVGAPIVQLDCHYRLARGEDIPVSVRYALPIDLNPWNDFYIGCTSVNHEQAVSVTDHAWNTRERVYRVVGDKTWSLATFIDAGQMLRTADVPRFEAVTRAMLKSAQPYAHNCKLAGNGDPVGVKSMWTFNFDVKTTKAGVTSSATTRGSFVTASASGNTFGTIANLFAADFHLNVREQGEDAFAGDPRRRADRVQPRLRLDPADPHPRDRIERRRVPEGREGDTARLEPESHPTARGSAGLRSHLPRRQGRDQRRHEDRRIARARPDPGRARPHDVSVGVIQSS